MGVVYRARQVKLDRQVALKVLPPDAAADPAFAERFTREARALARLNHPHIIAIYDFGQEGSLSYFVMEYVEGLNLRQRLAKRLPPTEAVAIVLQLCDALEYAHEEGIVHRDIKPENVLLDKKGRAKIADFGIAKLLQRKTAQYTLTGPWQVVGTLHYMAPEQMDNPLGLDHRADIFSLGVVFYEMLTGGLPLGRFPRPSEKAAVDQGIDEVVLRALEADPARRFQSVREMKAALETGAGPPVRLGSADRTKTDATGAAPPAPEEATAVVPEEPPPIDARIVRRRLKTPADFLSVTGILAFMGLAVVPIILRLTDWVPPKGEASHQFLLVQLLFAPLAGVILLWGAHKMRRVESYRWAVVACLAGLIPYNPLCWVLGLPGAIWGLVLLRRPDVRMAFPGMKPRPIGPGRIHRFLRTATGWALLACLAGVALTMQPVWPWAEVRAVPSVGDSGQPAAQQPNVKGGNGGPVLSKANPPVLGEVFGYQTVHGILPALLFATLFLVLATTAFLGPVPLWQPIVFLAAGALVCVTVLAGMQGDAHIDSSQLFDGSSRGTVIVSAFHKDFWGEFTCMYVLGGRTGTRAKYRLAGAVQETAITYEGPATPEGALSRLRVKIGFAPYATIALGFGLVLLGSLQLRGILKRRHENATPVRAEGGG
jgi:hypothetical protein